MIAGKLASPTNGRLCSKPTFLIGSATVSSWRQAALAAEICNASAIRRSETFIDGIELAVLDPRAGSQQKSGPFDPLLFSGIRGPIRPPSPS
jgi:hypothetical protein